MLLVNSVGVSSALGGLAQAFAAYQAGLSRVAPLPDLELMFPGEDAPEGVRGLTAGPATFGFTGVGRLTALVVEALRDLGTSIARDALRERAGLFFVTADPAERGIHGPWSDDEQVEPDARGALMAKELLSRVEIALGLPLRTAPAHFVVGTHCATARALVAAAAAIARAEISLALVIAVDSLVTEAALAPFVESRRLKTSDHATGFIPGEAAVAFTLSARSGRAQPLAAIEQVLERSTRARGDGAPEGRVLATAILDAWKRVPRSSTPIPFLVSDHDGEVLRAHELGLVQHHLEAKLRGLGDAPIWLPAVGFGNTGAASAALAIAMATRGYARERAPASTAMICSSGDDGTRAVIEVSARESSTERRVA